MRGRVFFGVACAALAVSVVFIVWREKSRDEPGEHADSGPVAGEPTESPRTSFTPASSDAERPAVADSERHDVTEEPAPDLVLIEGTAIAVDDQGVEHASEDGSFQLQAWKRGSEELQSESSIAVHSGHWSAQIRRDSVCAHYRLVLGGHDVDSEVKRDTIAPNESDSPNLRGAWPARVRLHVRDAATGGELPIVDVANSNLSPSVIANKAPGSGLFSLVRQSSPVEIWPTTRRPSELWASAAGYEAGQILVSFDHPGERVVLLRPVGELEIEIVGWIEEFGACVWARPVDGDARAVDASVDARGRAKVLDLPIGRYSIAIEVPSDRLNHRQFASAEAEVRAGELTHVTLQAHFPPKQASVDFAGEFIASDDWHVDRFICSVELIDTPFYRATSNAGFPTDAGVSLGDGRSVYRWKVWNMQPGRYDMRVREACFHRVIEIVGSPTRPLSFEIGQPGVVRVIDATTLEKVDMGAWDIRCRAADS